ncbi:hypothetical protein O181_079952 [Austropuccinia psidii MF-1]|uniref:Uncharacterized protein n=1 Tax=Austropuccinia psidii MF-1 TaxID=1389203 RepID=A0A9Q3IH08_9BASI|nr:hypothetical protein [Austropuccinia psidii MF-1]
MSKLIEERQNFLAPLKAQWHNLKKDKAEYETLSRASAAMLDVEEPSVRTYYSIKSLAMEFIHSYPHDPRGYKELAKIYLYSCVSELLPLAQEALDRAQNLSGCSDPETWYLLSACYRIRLFGSVIPSASQITLIRNQSRPKTRKRYLHLAERALKSALLHSKGSNLYLFALSDFYLSTRKVSKALTTLLSALSPSQQSKSDAAVFHQLGRLGISCLAGLNQKGRKERAIEVGTGALEYYIKAIQIGGSDAHHWKLEMETAKTIVDQIFQGSYDKNLSFDPESTLDLSGLRTFSDLDRALSPSTHNHSQNLSESSCTLTLGLGKDLSSLQLYTTASEKLTELGKIENEAATYEYEDDPSLTPTRKLHKLCSTFKGQQDISKNHFHLSSLLM